jgi:hypothetical protein
VLVLSSTSQIRIHVAGDVFAIDDPLLPFTQWKKAVQQAPLDPVPYSKQVLSPLGQQPAKKASPFDI